MTDTLSARIVAHYLGGEEALAAPLRARIEAAGIRVVSAQNHAALRKLINAVHADILLVSSQQLPNPVRTIPVLRRLYGRQGLAMVVLVAGDDPGKSAADSVAAGADDVITMPADAELLLARIDAALLTVEQFSSPAAWPKNVLRTADGEVALDVRGQRCLVREAGGYREVFLTRKQMAALTALLKADGRPVSFENLFRRGWRPGKLQDKSRTLVQHILALRRKLGAAGHRISAVPGTGYRLV